MTGKSESEKTVHIRRVNSTSSSGGTDSLAVEEPMEIRIVFGPPEKRTERSLSITMRTPDHDEELAAGFLLTEGILARRDQIDRFEFCGPVAKGRRLPNIIRVYLSSDVTVAMERLQRHFYTTSSCGICGKASLEALYAQGLQAIQPTKFTVSAATIYSLPGLLRSSQSVFDRTGGIHAAALVTAEGRLVSLREDVGRHNAMDKLIGRQWLDGKVPLHDQIVVVSGRASFELMQKALMASIPMLVAVGAPSSLAVDLAEQFNMTLVGFTSPQRFNIYAGAARIQT
jgi:FdhD protein